MKLAINGTYIQEQASGLGVVTENLLRELMNSDLGGDVTLYTTATRLQTQYGDRCIQINSNLAPDRGISGHLRRLWWYQTSLPRQLKKQNLSLFYSPANEGMLFPSLPQVVTVHDLIPLKYPEVSPKWRYYYLYVLPWLLKQSAKIICVSEHTKRDLIATYGIDPESIHVVYNGCDRTIFYPQSNPEILEKYHLKRYFLYVGDMRFYKNLDRCLKAFDRLPQSDYQFAIVGSKDDFFYPQLKQKTEQLAAKDRIVFLDYVPTEDLPILYSMAQSLVFASLYEGFGLPVLEAMACGCPVIASDRTSIPEVGGDSVLYINPDDIDDIARGMQQILQDRNLREKLSHQGIARAKLFTWSKTALGIKRVLEMVSC